MPTDTKSSVAEPLNAVASDDKTAVVVGLAEKLAVECSTIRTAVSDSQTFNSAVEPLVRPLITLKNNGINAPDASLVAFQAACAQCEARWTAEGEPVEALTAFLEQVDLFVDLLAPVDLGTLSTQEGARLADLLDRIVPLAGIMFNVTDEAIYAAQTGLQAWRETLDTLAAAILPDVTASDVPSRTGKRTGQWVQDHGWEVAYTSDKTHVT